jgi:hypothetical protein
MATKTFKLGEVCKGGVITVVTKGNNVTIIAKDWDFSAGSKKGSNQSNAKEFDREEANMDNESSTRQLSNFLYDLTTSYHTDQIMEWIKSKVDINSQMFW